MVSKKMVAFRDEVLKLVSVFLKELKPALDLPGIISNSIRGPANEYYNGRWFRIRRICEKCAERRSLSFDEKNLLDIVLSELAKIDVFIHFNVLVYNVNRTDDFEMTVYNPLEAIKSILVISDFVSRLVLDRVPVIEQSEEDVFNSATESHGGVAEDKTDSKQGDEVAVFNDHSGNTMKTDIIYHQSGDEVEMVMTTQEADLVENEPTSEEQFDVDIHLKQDVVLEMNSPASNTDSLLKTLNSVTHVKHDRFVAILKALEATGTTMKRMDIISSAKDLANLDEFCDETWIKDFYTLRDNGSIEAYTIDSTIRKGCFLLKNEYRSLVKSLKFKVSKKRKKHKPEK